MISKPKQPTAKRWLPKKCEEKDRMKTKTLRRLFSMLAALVMGLSLLTGCSEKNAERTQAGAPQIHLNSLSVFLLLCSFRIFFAASGEQG